MTINWFPGHMAKTKRLITENLKLVDIVIELLDARMPMSSENPLIDKLIGNKPRLVVLNKADMADERITDMWLSYYTNKKIPVITANSSDHKGINKIYEAMNEVLREKIARVEQKGLKFNMKTMVVGIPNVGKSSFINKLTRTAGAKTGNRPGVTKGKQWVRLKEGYELLDTPGILWPKFEDQSVAEKLAFAGSIKDEILDIEELSMKLLIYLKDNYKTKLCERYNIEFPDDIDAYELLCMIGKKRGFMLKGGETDITRTANMVLDELRNLKLGKISLERPDEYDSFSV